MEQRPLGKTVGGTAFLWHFIADRFQPSSWPKSRVSLLLLQRRPLKIQRTSSLLELPQFLTAVCQRPNLRRKSRRLQPLQLRPSLTLYPQTAHNKPELVSSHRAVNWAIVLPPTAKVPQDKALVHSLGLLRSPENVELLETFYHDLISDFIEKGWLKVCKSSVRLRRRRMILIDSTLFSPMTLKFCRMVGSHSGWAGEDAIGHIFEVEACRSPR